MKEKSSFDVEAAILADFQEALERLDASQLREFVASLAYLVMTWAPLEHLVFVFPELLLVLLGCTLLLGRYSGYRLLELFRFRALARERQAAIDQGKVAPPGGTGGTPAP